LKMVILSLILAWLICSVVVSETGIGDTLILRTERFSAALYG
jgi:hypothetical protein